MAAVFGHHGSVAAVPIGAGSRPMPSGQARRGAATLVDVAVWAPVAVLAWRRRRAGDPAERPSWRNRLVLRIPMSMYVIGSSVALGGTPGYRVFGLRVVDRATDENPGWRQAALRWAAATIPSAIAGEAMRAYLQRRIDPWARRSAELHEEVERLRDEHPDDDEAVDRAIGALDMDLAGGLNLLPLLALYASWWVATIAMARRDPQRRTLPDRFSGTVVVRTRMRSRG